MEATEKILGQVKPAATTSTDLYTVPLACQAQVNTVSVCNQSASDATFRISARKGGEALAAKQYLIYDATIKANDSIFLTLGLTLAQTDVITVYSSAADLSFGLFGDQSRTY